MTGPPWGGGHCRLGSCTHRDCAHPQSCLVFRGISVTQLKHLVRRHYLLQRKRGAGRGELAARRFAHHYAPLTALKSESRGSSDSLGGFCAPGRRRWQEGPGEVVWHPRVSSFLGPHPASISRSRHRMVWHHRGAAFDHSPWLQKCSPLLKCVPFPGTWIAPLGMSPACAEGKQASKSPDASLCFIPGGTGVLSPEWRAGVGAQGDQGSFDAAGLFTNDVRYPVPLGALGIEQRGLWVGSTCQASPGSTELRCSFTFPSSQDLFHPFFDLPLPLLLLLFFFSV